MPIMRAHAGVAQSVEQRTRNAKVAGSIPVSGTILVNQLCDFSLVSLLAMTVILLQRITIGRFIGSRQLSSSEFIQCQSLELDKHYFAPYMTPCV